MGQEDLTFQVNLSPVGGQVDALFMKERCNGIRFLCCLQEDDIRLAIIGLVPVQVHTWTTGSNQLAHPALMIHGCWTHALVLQAGGRLCAWSANNIYICVNFGAWIYESIYPSADVHAYIYMLAYKITMPCIFRQKPLQYIRSTSIA
jgi:hypothetical protein